MSTGRNGRQVFANVWKTFIDSFSARKAEKRGNYVGADLFGNKFYENPADPSRGKRLARRSFEPTKEMQFDVDNMSAEWDAWLRHRRKEPPTIEELKNNLAISQMKQSNAQKLLEKEGKSLPLKKDTTNMTKFPQYEEYESNPGKNSTKFDS